MGAIRKCAWLMVAAIACVVLAAGLWWRSEHPSRATLKAQGESMIAAVEVYRQRHGEYPPSLADAGVAPPAVGYGPWRYLRTGAYFSLAVGDYGRDGFVLSYVSGGRGWYLDD